VEPSDVDVLEREVSSSRDAEWTVARADGKQPRIARIERFLPLERRTITLNGDFRKNDRGDRRPKFIVGVTVPEVVKGEDGSGGQHDCVAVTCACYTSGGVSIVRTGLIDRSIRFEF